MTFQTLYEAIAKWLGLSSSSTDLLAERKAFVNTAYRDVISSYDWETRKGSGVVQTTAPESASTLQAASAGDTAITIDDANWDTTWIGRKIRIGNAIYRVSSFDSTSTATLANGLVADVDAGSTYVVFQDEYDLPTDCARIITVRPGHPSMRPLERVSIEDIEQLQSVFWDPVDYADAYAELGSGSSGSTPSVILSSIPASIYNLELRYEREITEMSATTDTPDLLPLHAHHLIEARAKCLVYELDRSAASMLARADRDYERKLLLEITRARQNEVHVRMDPKVYL
jgi:hypothetical protein